MTEHEAPTSGITCAHALSTRKPIVFLIKEGETGEQREAEWGDRSEPCTYDETNTGSLKICAVVDY